MQTIVDIAQISGLDLSEVLHQLESWVAYRLTGGLLSIDPHAPSCATNIAPIPAYCTRHPGAGGSAENWQASSFQSLSFALSFYVNLAAKSVCPHFATADHYTKRLVKMECIWKQPVGDIVKDNSVLSWIKQQHPTIDMDTATVREVVHVEHARNRRSQLDRTGQTLLDTCLLEVCSAAGDHHLQLYCSMHGTAQRGLDCR